MPNGGIYLNRVEAEAQLKVIEEDIKALSDILKSVNTEMLKLDAKVWAGKEKDKIDEQYMPYLDKLDKKSESYLTRYVTAIRQSFDDIDAAELANKQIIEEKLNDI